MAPGVVALVGRCQTGHDEVHDEDQVEDHECEEEGIAKEGTDFGLLHLVGVVAGDSRFEECKERGLQGCEVRQVGEEDEAHN